MALSQPFSLVKYGRPEHVRGGAFSGLGKERGVDEDNLIQLEIDFLSLIKK